MFTVNLMKNSFQPFLLNHKVKHGLFFNQSFRNSRQFFKALKIMKYHKKIHHGISLSGLIKATHFIRWESFTKFR